MLDIAIESIKRLLEHSEDMQKNLPECIACTGEIAAYKKCIALIERLKSD